MIQELFDYYANQLKLEPTLIAVKNHPTAYFKKESQNKLKWCLKSKTTYNGTTRLIVYGFIELDDKDNDFYKIKLPYKNTHADIVATKKLINYHTLTGFPNLPMAMLHLLLQAQIGFD